MNVTNFRTLVRRPGTMKKKCYKIKEDCPQGYASYNEYFKALADSFGITEELVEESENMNLRSSSPVDLYRTLIIYAVQELLNLRRDRDTPVSERSPEVIDKAKEIGHMVQTLRDLERTSHG